MQTFKFRLGYKQLTDAQTASHNYSKCISQAAFMDFSMRREMFRHGNCIVDLSEYFSCFFQVLQPEHQGKYEQMVLKISAAYIISDRSETARLLLELNAPIGVSDNQGQKAITWMITKMAPVVSPLFYQYYICMAYLSLVLIEVTVQLKRC